jgi:hypothetical protein
MNTNTHPDIELFNEYLDQTDSVEFNDLRMHLASCGECRSELEALTVLRNHHHELGSAENDEVDQQNIMDYIDGHLSGKQLIEAEKSIENSAAALKSALHYATHSASMDEALQVNKAVVDESGKFVGLFSKLAGLLQFNAPIWVSVPITAVIVSAFIVSLQTGLYLNENELQVTAYQDDAMMQFKKSHSLPGMGFFSKTHQYTKAYNNMGIKLDENRLDFNWPVVEGAVSYNLRVQYYAQGQSIEIDTISTIVPHAQINIKLSDINHRYEWVLSGTTSDEMNFSAQGGFVINNAR